MTETAARAAPLVPALLLVLITTFALFLTILIGSYVLIRIFRRRKQSLKHEASMPTEHVDVWQLHKVPEDSDEDG